MKNAFIKSLLACIFLTTSYSIVCSQDFPIDLTKLSPGDSIVISYQANVDENMPTDLNMVNCQTTVTAGDGLVSVVSNDPRTPELNDPTQVQIAIPTMSQWSIIILGLLLANLAIIAITEQKKVLST